MHSNSMNDWDALLEHWSVAELRDDLGITYETAASMKRRGSVAPRHWPALIAGAAKKSLPVDEAMLVRLHVNGKRRVASRSAAA